MRTLRLLGINLALTLLLLLAVEGCVRLTHPDLGPVGTDAGLTVGRRFGEVSGPRPNARGLSEGAVFTVSADGFWQYAGAAPDSTRGAWLFLGDSVTMGIGVDPDSTFAGRVAAALDTVRILNPSLVAFQPSDYVAILRHVLDHSGWAIERATVFWCLNDAYPPPSWAGATPPTVHALGGDLIDFLRRHARTYQWVRASFADRPLTYFQHDRRYYASEEAFAPAAAALDTLAALAAAYDVRLDLVALPYEAQLRADAPADAFGPQRRLRRAARARGLPFYDAARAFPPTEPPTESFRYGDGIHFSRHGHARIARFVLDHL